MQNFIYHASFYLYEISFIVFGLALIYGSLAYRKINQAMQHPPMWLGPLIAGILLCLCAINHFVVYRFLSPLYMLNQSHQLLIIMYVFKTISMASVLVSGVLVVLAYYWYWKKIMLASNPLA